MRSIKMNWVISFFVSIAFGILLIVGCTAAGQTTITFEIPVGYSGILKIIEDRNASVPIRTDTGYLISFSKSGVATINSIDLLTDYFVGKAQFSNGEPIDFYAVEEKAGNEYAVWLLPRGVKSEAYLFLGYKKDAAQYIKQNPEIYRT